MRKIALLLPCIFVLLLPTVASAGIRKDASRTIKFHTLATKGYLQWLRSDLATRSNLDASFQCMEDEVALSGSEINALSQNDKLLLEVAWYVDIEGDGARAIPSQGNYSFAGIRDTMRQRASRVRNRTLRLGLLGHINYLSALRHRDDIDFCSLLSLWRTEGHQRDDLMVEIENKFYSTSQGTLDLGTQSIARVQAATNKMSAMGIPTSSIKSFSNWIFTPGLKDLPSFSKKKSIQKAALLRLP